MLAPTIVTVRLTLHVLAATIWVGGQIVMTGLVGAARGLGLAVAERLHELIKATVPDLSPKTWYGMPAYAKDGKVVCFFRNAGKFKERYAMFGFNDTANLDQGAMWPIAFALKDLTAADETKLRTLVERRRVACGAVDLSRADKHDGGRNLASCCRLEQVQGTDRIYAKGL